jgi:ankyrin repeat protein
MNDNDPFVFFEKNGKNNKLVKEHIDTFGDFDRKEIYGYKLIHFICWFSTPEMIKYIIDKGVDIDIANNDGWKPIHYICRYSTPEMIKYIIDKGVWLEDAALNRVKPIHLLVKPIHLLFDNKQINKYERITLIEAMISSNLDLDNLEENERNYINELIEQKYGLGRWGYQEAKTSFEQNI